MENEEQKFVVNFHLLNGDKVCKTIVKSHEVPMNELHIEALDKDSYGNHYYLYDDDGAFHTIMKEAVVSISVYEYGNNFSF